MDQTGPLNRTALHECAFLGLENFVFLLLESGADPNVRDITDRTPLALAAQNGHLTVVEELLQKGTELRRRRNKVHNRTFGPSSRQFC